VSVCVCVIGGLTALLRLAYICLAVESAVDLLPCYDLLICLAVESAFDLLPCYDLLICLAVESAAGHMLVECCTDYDSDISGDRDCSIALPPRP